MKIGFVTNFYPPIQTGTSYYTRDLAAALAQRGHDTLVVTSGVEGAPDEEVVDGVRVHRVNGFQLPRAPLLLGFDQYHLAYRPRVSRHLTEVIGDFGVDLLHQCGHLLDLTYLTPRIARGLGVPAACSVHTMIRIPKRPFVDRVFRTLDRFVLGNLAIKRYDSVFALDAEIERYVRDRYGHPNVVRVPWGVSFDFSVERRPPEETRALRMVSVGHVTDMRDRRALIDAIAQLRQEGIDVDLTIIGKECTQVPRHHAERRGVGDRVAFTGELPRESVLDELVHADVQGHWISNPAVGSSGMESMAMGVPTMLWATSDLLGFAELRHMENVVLIDPDDPNSIATVLRKLDADRSMLDEIGREGRETARSAFMWDSAAGDMETIYSGMVASKGL